MFPVIFKLEPITGRFIYIQHSSLAEPPIMHSQFLILVLNTLPLFFRLFGMTNKKDMLRRGDLRQVSIVELRGVDCRRD